MKLEIVRWHAQASRDASAYPRLVLEMGRDWADWPTTEAASRNDAYETLFDVYYEEQASASRPRPLGSVKILQRGRRAPELVGSLSALPDDCCSLGQTIDYYEAVEQLGELTCEAILTTLRDVTTNETIARSFEHEPGFRESLIRFSEAEYIFRSRPRRLHRDPPPPESLRFRFYTKLAGFDDPHEVDFAFLPGTTKLSRLMAIVGKNGTGKTQLLSRLAWALWGLRRTGEEIDPPRPPIGRVIAISYSALDVFERPPHGKRGLDMHPAFDSYHYCGFRDVDDAIRPEVLFEVLAEDLEEIARRNLRPAWEQMLYQIHLLDGEPDLVAALSKSDAAFVAASKSLGAGEKTALSVLTRLLATLRNRAFVLFDEPELNLHPSLLAGVLRVLHDWLAMFDGHGVLATHSPIVLQEIPGRSVHILDRVGKVPFVRPYESESFGQTLSEIVGEVFGLDEHHKNYASVLRELIESGMSPEQIEQSFGRPLSLNARMALRYLERRGGGDAKT